MAGQPQIMIISIPLDSPSLLIAGVLFGLGMIITPISARLGVVGIGTATVIMGSVVLLTIPNGFGAIGPWIVPFGSTVIVGVWMIMIGMKNLT
jgi:hypothetical protein